VLIPWCRHFVAMIVVHVLIGVVGCMLDIGKW